mgnify:CR=1 FL=1
MTLRWNLLAPKRRAALVVASATCALFALAGSAQAALPTVTVSVGASSVTVGGALQSGAVNVVSTSTKKETEVILLAVKPGVSVAEVEAFAKSNKQKDPNNADKYGTIAFDVEANPGAATEAQTDLQAGQYIVLTGEGEKPVAIRTTFTVAPAASPAAMPTPEATVRSIEFGFRGPTTLRDGELVRFENEGFLVHMDIAFPVKSKAAAQQVVKLLLAGKEKGIEKLVAGPPAAFAGPLSSGAFQQEIVTAKPGWYVQACFMETQDGRDHTRLGMERVFKILK